jgi:hypothetical protein
MLVLLAGTVACADAPSSVRPFADYQVILDRKPFGTPPDRNAAPVERVVSIQESFAAQMQILAFYEEDTNVRVAIVDRRDNSYFSLLTGESEGGIELIDVDYEKEEAVLKKGEEVVVLTMGSAGSSQVLSGTEREERAKQAAERRLSYAERRKQRMLARQTPQEIPKPIYTGKELEEHLQNYQMEVIRQGLPPLPVQLTADRDAQLVEEGYLPPVDEQGFEIDPHAVVPEGYEEYGEYEDGYYDEGDYAY